MGFPKGDQRARSPTPAGVSPQTQFSEAAESSESRHGAPEPQLENLLGLQAAGASRHGHRLWKLRTVAKLALTPVPSSVGD